MNASSLTSRQRSCRAGWLLALVLALTMFLPPPARAVEPSAKAFIPAAALTAPADLQSILGNRTRMIQTATIVMMLAIAFLMWGKK